jgi:putative hemolysin
LTFVERLLFDRVWYLVIIFGIAAGCFLASMFFAVVCECLRNFLRSRLAFVCRIHHREDRFGIILRDDEAALQASGALGLLTLLLAVLLGGYQRYGIGTVTGWTVAIDGVVLVAVSWILLVVVPWTLSRVAAEYILFHAWPVIHWSTRCMQPMLSIARRIDTLSHRVAGRQDPQPENLETIAEEIQSVVDEGEREGILESRSGKMIQRVMELRQEDVRAVMTPRTDIVTVQAECSLSEARQQLLQSGHSRIPVVDGSTDDIVGILYARDLLEHMGNGEAPRETDADAAEAGSGPPVTLREIVRPPFYVPETTSIDALLDRMKQERLHMAIVLDEYGGVTGLVTLEDILEEIVGNIEDEFDPAEAEQVQVVDEHTIWVDARMHLDELNDAFDLTLPEDRDFDTIGGFVFSELGRVPKTGEKFNWDKLQITVLEATDRKLIRLQLTNSDPWPALAEQTASFNGSSETPAPLRLLREENPEEQQAS